MQAEAFDFAAAFAFALGAAGAAPLASFTGFSSVLGRNGRWLGARLQKVGWDFLSLENHELWTFGASYLPSSPAMPWMKNWEIYGNGVPLKTWLVNVGQG